MCFVCTAICKKHFIATRVAFTIWFITFSYSLVNITDITHGNQRKTFLTRAFLWLPKQVRWRTNNWTCGDDHIWSREAGPSPAHCSWRLMVAPRVRSACYKDSLDACLLSSFGNTPLLLPSASPTKWMCHCILTKTRFNILPICSGAVVLKPGAITLWGPH